MAHLKFRAKSHDSPLPPPAHSMSLKSNPPIASRLDRCILQSRLSFADIDHALILPIAVLNGKQDCHNQSDPLLERCSMVILQGSLQFTSLALDGATLFLPLSPMAAHPGEPQFPLLQTPHNFPYIIKHRTLRYSRSTSRWLWERMITDTS